MTELDASTGALVQVLEGGLGSKYNFYYPESISSDGTHVWVATLDGVTELDASSGSVVAVLKNSQYGFKDSVSIFSDGTHVWVAKYPRRQRDRAQRLRRARGGAVSSSYGFYNPDAVSSDGTDVWVANSATTREGSRER